MNNRQTEQSTESATPFLYSSSNSKDGNVRRDSLDPSLSSFVDDRRLREKQFLLSCERGDIGSVRKCLETAKQDAFDINCVDPLGRSALHIAIENENIEMIELLLDHNIETGDAILYAIGEENVEAVEIIVEHLEKIDKYNPETQGVEINEHSAFTPDMTPIILSAHKDNYECIKLFLDKKATVPHPHDVRCCCPECETAREEDSLRLSRSRLNAYRALTSPSLICLSAKDPILYAFELSWELRRLSYIENEFRSEYQELSQKCQKFSVNMLDQVRGSKELEIVLNHTTKAWQDVTSRGTTSSDQLARLKLAIQLRQKRFVAHPNCQQLLAGIWYEGLPGFRNRHIVFKVLLILAVSMCFPLLSVVYLFAPHSSIGAFMRKPFVKFLSHSASYIFFLFLLILASQRIQSIDNLFGKEQLVDGMVSTRKERRGPAPTPVEMAILAWVSGLIWVEIKQLWDSGLHDYCHNLWNILDFITNSLYLSTAALRAVAYYQVEAEAENKATAHLAGKLLRRDWDAWDPTLISESVFATANIFSSLKLVHIFTINPHLGPLKISLGRMVLDILKFFLVYCLVLFAFACGLNQLMWYYASMREMECLSYKNLVGREEEFRDDPNFQKNLKIYEDSCDPKYRSCASLYSSMETLFWASFGIIDLPHFDILEEHWPTQWTGRTIFGAYCWCSVIVLLNIIYHTVETLFWAMFGLVDLTHFSLKEGHRVTEWTGKTIFGSYSVISIIVLLNMLVAMMANSYMYISNQADVEWKFARSKLWIEYFDDTATLPPPFNMIPSPKSCYYALQWVLERFCCAKIVQQGKQKSMRKIISKISTREADFRFVTRNLVKRYIAQMQRMKQQNEGVSEDDVNEIKQDISAFRYELLGILRAAGFNTGHTDINQKTYSRNKKRSAMAERRMLKGLPEFEMPVPESFTNPNRRISIPGTPETTKPMQLPLKLPQLNWRRLKKKVSFRGAEKRAPSGAEHFTESPEEEEELEEMEMQVVEQEEIKSTTTHRQQSPHHRNNHSSYQSHEQHRLPLEDMEESGRMGTRWGDQSRIVGQARLLAGGASVAGESSGVLRSRHTNPNSDVWNLDGKRHPKSMSFDAAATSRHNPFIDALQRFSNAYNDRPRLKKQKRQSEETVLEMIDADEIL
ncbi:unnamed protein product, partial [Mesorhabditis belari]|uniref:Transient receptor ion channel domain-containing protein n=1 Tax=Mesorhabditis belari TaxID=2138241 RepID=A0AAF3EAP5_9BILA